MASDSKSFLDKVKDIFSRMFKSKKDQNSSFKTPQELQRSKYGTTSSSRAAKSSSSGAPMKAEISQSAPPPAPPKKQVLSSPHPQPQPKAPVQSVQPTQRSQPVVGAIPRIQQEDKSADVSPTEPRAFRTDRPHSEAVSALEQEDVAESVSRASVTERTQESSLKEDRPISDMASSNSTRAAQSPIVPEKKDLEAEDPVKITPAHDETTAPQSETVKSETEAVAEEEPKPLTPDRVDPTTAPEVVNEFDDEKVPVIAEPMVHTPADTKFRMSATSGPLEDFPAGGDYYA